MALRNGSWIGKLPKITIEVAERIGTRVGEAETLENALAQEDPGIPLEHWNKAMKQSRIAMAYAAKRAIGARALLDQVDPANKGWQAAAWKLERAHGYTTKHSDRSITVNVTTVAGLPNEILARSRAFVVRKSEPAELKQARVKQVTDKDGDTVPLSACP